MNLRDWSGRQIISRILYLNLAIQAAIIHLGFGSSQSSSGLPGNQNGPSSSAGFAGATFPYLALLRVGFTKPIRYRTAGALLPHLFTLTAVTSGGMFSVALSVPYGPSSYEAHCPAEFGLSSAGRSRKRSPICPPANYCMLAKNFCNCSGNGEWNCRGAPVTG